MLFTLLRALLAFTLGFDFLWHVCGGLLHTSPLRSRQTTKQLIFEVNRPSSYARRMENRVSVLL